jgi:hypothetical protein
MRRSSMKLSADTEHNTDPNMIITIVSIGRELLPHLPMYQTLSAGVGHGTSFLTGSCERALVEFWVCVGEQQGERRDGRTQDCRRLCAQEDPDENRFAFLPPGETGYTRTRLASACRTNFLEESRFSRSTEDGFGPPSPRAPGSRGLTSRQYKI